MRKVLKMCLWTLIVSATVPVLAHGGIITAAATPLTNAALKDQSLSVSVTVVIEGLDEKLGSYTATLKWDSQVLKYTGYQPGSTSGFTQVVNERRSGEGLIIFAGVNPYGADGSVHLLNVMFQVIGSEGSQCDFNLEFSDMMSANTFNDLLPYLQSVQTGVEQSIAIGEQPREYALDQNYPNPFNPSTRISYSLPQAAHVTINIFNAQGQIVRTLVDEQKGIGKYTLDWDGRDDAGVELPIGAYLYKMQAGSFTATKQMLYLK